MNARDSPTASQCWLPIRVTRGTLQTLVIGFRPEQLNRNLHSTSLELPRSF